MEIQDAVTRLPADEKNALSLWLNSQAAPTLSAPEEQQLLRSLDDANRDVDAGRGVSLADAHQLVASITNLLPPRQTAAANPSCHV